MIPGTPSAGSGIEVLIVEETHALRDFLDLLRQEQMLLLDGQADRLIPLAEEKNRTSAHLSRLALQRGQALVAAGYGSGPAAITAWLRQLPPNAPQQASWRLLLDVATRARLLNEENGALIRARLQHNQRALTVLAAASAQATLYGPDGQAFAGAGKRHLGSV